MAERASTPTSLLAFGRHLQNLGAHAGVAAAVTRRTSMKVTGIVPLLALALTMSAHAQTSTNATLGSVRIPQPVMVDGTSLPAGSYQLRLVGQPSTGGGAVGTTGSAAAEGPWIEFVQNGQAKGRVLAIVAPDPAKVPSGIRAQRVRNDDDGYVRVSIGRGQQHYLAYLPTR
jgi:hypothetical protein